MIQFIIKIKNIITVILVITFAFPFPNGIYDIEEAQAGIKTQVFITITGASTWTVPRDWNSQANVIEAIGGGGGGNDVCGTHGCGGGGGGAYAYVRNISLTRGSSVNVNVGVGGGDAVKGEDTWFGAAASTSANVVADGGKAGSGNTGGTGGSTADSV